jgi:hypothetical protein
MSILTSFSKIIKRLVCTRLYTHVDKNNILANEQYVFRTHTSTKQASYMLINGILTVMNCLLFIIGDTLPQIA